MQTAIKENSNTDIMTGVIKTLVYFHLFNYPLTSIEVHSFSALNVSPLEITIALEQLVTERVLFRHENYYSLLDDSSVKTYREKGNKKAAELLPLAARKCRLLFSFPFTKLVAVSGSLSKNFATEKDDIDYFIVVKKNRLWIARTLLHCLKKLAYLRGRQHLYCMNYFIDETALEIIPKNIFTAIELKTIKAFGDADTLFSLEKNNSWADEWLPNLKIEFKHAPHNFFKKVIEKIFDNRVGDLMNEILYKISERRWKIKFQKGAQNIKGVTMNLETGKHFARSNPGNFQQKILLAYDDQLTKLEEKFSFLF